MAIKPVSTDMIKAALVTFDQELRSTNEWSGWDQSKAQRHAIFVEGHLYPPKKIISLATGMPVAAFRGGPESNGYLRQRGFQIVPLSAAATKLIPQFVVGKVYQRSVDINGLYGGNAQSGISSSSSTDAVFLFTGDSGEQFGYHDGPGIDENGRSVFRYAGEGQLGDMKFDRGNRALLEHSQEGRALHLFRSRGKGKGYTYLGEYVYAGHELTKGHDKAETERQVIVFHLLPVGEAERLENQEPSEEPIVSLSLEEARKLAVQASGTNGSESSNTSSRNIYKRSKAVKDYVLMRANGRCESCEKPAPFLRRDGTPYLEPHHTTRVSDGGPDHPRYVGAICPDCHREIHHGEKGERRNEKLRIYLLDIEEA